MSWIMATKSFQPKPGTLNHGHCNNYYPQYSYHSLKLEFDDGRAILLRYWRTHGILVFIKRTPQLPGLTALLAWRFCGIPPQASIGSVPLSFKVTWTLDYGVCIAKFDKDGQKYVGKQFIPALYLGNVYKAVYSQD